MDKEKRIAELDFVIRKAEIEKAYHNGAKLVFSEIGVNAYKDYYGSHGNFAWGFYDYKVKEEPRRIPFDGSDAFGLAKCIFKEIDEDYIFHLPLEVGNVGARFNRNFVNYEDLSENWLKWNDLKKEWQPCNKVA